MWFMFLVAAIDDLTSLLLLGILGGRRGRGMRRGRGGKIYPTFSQLNIEQEMTNIAVLHDISLSLRPKFTCQANFLFGPEFFQIG